jgi:hypothetical protein
MYTNTESCEYLARLIPFLKKKKYWGKRFSIEYATIRLYMIK